MVQPLKKKTMTLSQLQLRTLDVLRKVRFQFNRLPHEDAMLDLETACYADLKAECLRLRDVLQLAIKVIKADVKNYTDLGYTALAEDRESVLAEIAAAEGKGETCEGSPFECSAMRH